MMSTRTVRRDSAGTVRVATTWSPFSFENVSVTGARPRRADSRSHVFVEELPVAPSDRK